MATPWQPKHSNSRSWRSPRTQDNDKWQRHLKSRSRFCKDSPFFTPNMDRKAHEKAMADAKAASLLRKQNYEAEADALRQRLNVPPPPPLPPPFGGHVFLDNYGPVLNKRTVFCPNWEATKPVFAPWPSLAEMKYEGDERISTDRIHQRRLGLPRLPGNETVNWQHLTYVEPYELDEFKTDLHEIAIFMRTHWIPDIEPTDEDGKQYVGCELMGMLDSDDIF